MALRDDCTKLRSSLNSANKDRSVSVLGLDALKIDIQTLLQKNKDWQVSAKKKQGELNKAHVSMKKLSKTLKKTQLSLTTLSHQPFTET